MPSYLLFNKDMFLSESGGILSPNGNSRDKIKKAESKLLYLLLIRRVSHIKITAPTTAMNSEPRMP